MISMRSSKSPMGSSFQWLISRLHMVLPAAGFVHEWPPIKIRGPIHRIYELYFPASPLRRGKKRVYRFLISPWVTALSMASSVEIRMVFFLALVIPV